MDLIKELFTGCIGKSKDSVMSGSNSESLLSPSDLEMYRRGEWLQEGKEKAILIGTAICKMPGRQSVELLLSF